MKKILAHLCIVLLFSTQAQAGYWFQFVTESGESLGPELWEDADQYTGWTRESATVYSGAPVSAWSEFKQFSIADSGTEYKIVWSISSYTSGDIKPYVNGMAATPRNSEDTFIDYLTPTSNSSLAFQVQGVNFTGTVTVISVKEVL